MRILVMGATGFIGRNIAEKFSKYPTMKVTGVHNRVRPYDLPNLNWVQADLTNSADVDRVVRDADVIVQAAATTSGSKDIVSRPHIHVTDNAVMNALVFRAAHDHGVRHVVFFSCAIMYPSSNIPLKETDFDPDVPMHPRYFGAGWTKLYAEKMCEFYAGLGRTKFTAIRHSNIYGPHDKFDLERSHVMGATITKALTAQDGRITVWGRGTEGRDLLYVDDLVNMVHRAIERQQRPFGLYNVGLGEAVSVGDLVRMVVAASGRSLAVEHDLSKPSIDTTLSLDCGLVRDELGWEPKIPLAEGIARTIRWRHAQSN